MDMEHIVFHPEYIGLGAQAVLTLALKKGLHVQFDSTTYPSIPGRLYVNLKDGSVENAFEVKAS